MNNKALGNIVIVSLLIVVTISAIVIVWTFVLPIFNNLGKDFSPLNSSGNNSENNGDLNGGSSGGCELIKAYWNNDSTVEGDNVNLIVRGKNCNGKTASFEIREDDEWWGYDAVNITPFLAVFNGDVSTTSWKAEWQSDVVRDPEYYFIATVEGKNIKSGLLGVGLKTKFSPLEACKTIINNGRGGINIVIFADDGTANDYAEKFLSYEPMKANARAFNFFYIDSYKPDCEIYQGIAMLCRSKDMIKKASSCPNDYILVIESHSSDIRSSAFLNIMSINSALPPTVVQHEFGHVFAGLGEEYFPAILPNSAKNCAKNIPSGETGEYYCDKQFGNRTNIDRNGCFVECSNKDYYRSIDNGVMRTLSSNDYGLFNNKIMLQRLVESVRGISINPVPPLVTGGVVDLGINSDCSSREYYLLEGVSNGLENMTFSPNASVEQGCASSNGYGEVQYNITENGTSIISGSFNPIYIFTDGIGEEGVGGNIKGDINGSIGGYTYLNDEKFYLKIPKDKLTNETNRTIKTTGGWGGCKGGCLDHIDLDDRQLPV